MTDAPERIWIYKNSGSYEDPTTEYEPAFADAEDYIAYTLTASVEARLAAAEKLAEALRDIDRLTLWENSPLGRGFQERVETALAEWKAAKGERG